MEKLGAGVLEDVVTWLTGPGMEAPRQTERLLQLSTSPELKELADEVIAWGCAYPPLIT